jgi:thiol-disulfide isomerase/thioredoxin
MKINFANLAVLLIITKTCLGFKEWWEKSDVPSLTDDTFFDVVGKDKWVLVKFFTTWCRYCKLLQPEFDKVYEALKEERKDILIYRIECEKNTNTPALYGITSYPKMILFKPEQPNIHEIYKYQRTAEYIVSWLEDTVPKPSLKMLEDVPEAKPQDAGHKNITKISNQDNEEINFVKDEIKLLYDKLAGLEKELAIMKDNTIALINNKPNKEAEKKQKDNFKSFNVRDMVFIAILLFVIVAAILTVRKVYNKL